MAAISALETALWDILGQVAGQPLYNLLGGRCHDRVRVYVDGFFQRRAYIEEEYAEKAAEAVAAGFGALKMDVDEPIPMADASTAHVSTDGPAPTWRAWSNPSASSRSGHRSGGRCTWRVRCAIGVRLGKALEHLDLLWIEDPVPMNNLDAMAQVAEARRHPSVRGSSWTRGSGSASCSSATRPTSSCPTWPPAAACWR